MGKKQNKTKKTSKTAAKGAQAAAGCRDCVTTSSILGEATGLGMQGRELLCMHDPASICFIMVIPGAQSGGNNLLILCHFLTGVKIMEH